MSPVISHQMALAAVDADASQIRFTAQTLGAPAEGSPIPPVSELQELALSHNPGLRESQAMIQAQVARVLAVHQVPAAQARQVRAGYLEQADQGRPRVPPGPRVPPEEAELGAGPPLRLATLLCLTTESSSSFR